MPGSAARFHLLYYTITWMSIKHLTKRVDWAFTARNSSSMKSGLAGEGAYSQQHFWIASFLSQVKYFQVRGAFEEKVKHNHTHTQKNWPALSKGSIQAVLVERLANPALTDSCVFLPVCSSLNSVFLLHNSPDKMLLEFLLGFPRKVIICPKCFLNGHLITLL